MFDLLVKGGTLPDGTVADIGITGDRIAAVGRLDTEAAQVIDATGDLVAPPFVDPHFHMDATLSYGLPRVNASGTLLEGIALWGELRDIADSQRTAISRDLEQTGIRLVDHAAWRFAQLMAVGFVCLLAAGMLFLFVIRKLFVSPGERDQLLRRHRTAG